MGFTFDDTDKKGIASPLSEMERLVAKDPHNAERIFPYLGGEEVNDSPTHKHHRFVINFANFPLRREKFEGKSWMHADEIQRGAWLQTGSVPHDYPNPVAADWPDLLDIVERKVKLEREKLGGNSVAARRKQFWWQFGSPAKELATALNRHSNAFAISRVSEHFGFASLPTNLVFSDRLVVSPSKSLAFFGLLNSRNHEIWARFFSSSQEDRLMYAPSDCFETFPFPPDWETNAALEEAGKAYYEFRAELMIRNDEGLTKTYNRFHDPEESSTDIERLRALHAAMDRTVLDAYGWRDIPTDCEFLLDYEEDEDEPEPTRKRQKKKPWRYRWPDEVRDEVLARLLALNATRHAEELAAGTAPGMKGNKKPKPKKTEEDFQLE